MAEVTPNLSGCASAAMQQAIGQIAEIRMRKLQHFAIHRRDPLIGQANRPKPRVKFGQARRRAIQIDQIGFHLIKGGACRLGHGYYDGPVSVGEKGATGLPALVQGPRRRQWCGTTVQNIRASARSCAFTHRIPCAKIDFF